MGRRAGASIVVFGHIHIPMVHRYNDVLLVNPGAIASGNYIRRQTVQTVAILFLRDDGTPFVAHVDLVHPEQRFEPKIDWQAGFVSALSRYSGSLLALDLGAVWKELKPLRAVAPEAFGAAILRAAHRCWAGEQEVITKSDLLPRYGRRRASPNRCERALIFDPCIFGLMRNKRRSCFFVERRQNMFQNVIRRLARSSCSNT